MSAETLHGSAAAVLPTSSSLFQLPCLFPRSHPGEGGCCPGAVLGFNALQGKLKEVELCFY